MTNIRYLAPGTLEDAIEAFAAAGSAGRILAGGTDLLVQMRAGVRTPTGSSSTSRKSRKPPASRRPLAAASGSVPQSRAWRLGPSAVRQGLARRARRDQPDRLEAGARPRLGRRQPVQRLAGRRQRPCYGRGRRDRHDTGTERPPRTAGRKGAGRSRPPQPHAGRNRRQLHISRRAQKVRATHICA